MLKKIMRSLSKEKNPYYESEKLKDKYKSVIKKSKEEKELDMIFSENGSNIDSSKQVDNLFTKKNVRNFAEHLLENMSSSNPFHKESELHKEKLKGSIPNLPDFTEHTNILENSEDEEMPEGYITKERMNSAGGADLLFDEEIEDQILNLNKSSKKKKKIESTSKINAVSHTEKENNNTKSTIYSNKKISNEEVEDFIPEELKIDDDFELVTKDRKKYYKQKSKSINENDRVLTLRDKKSILKKEVSIKKKEEKILKETEKLETEKKLLKNVAKENRDLKKFLIKEEKVIFDRMKKIEEKNKDLELQKERFEKFVNQIIKDKEDVHRKEEDLIARETSLEENINFLNGHIEEIDSKQKDMKKIQKVLLKKVKDIEKKEKEVVKNHIESDKLKAKQIAKLEKIDDMHESLKEERKTIVKHAKGIKKGQDVKETIDKLYDAYNEIRERIKEEYKKLDELKKTNLTLETNNQLENTSVFSEKKTNGTFENIKSIVEKGLEQIEFDDLNNAKRNYSIGIEMYKSLPKGISGYKKKELYYDLMVLKHGIESKS